MTKNWQTFQYFESAGKGSPAIFLFHGTGGSEHDLLPLVEKFTDSHSIVSLLGNVREGRMARFFARYDDGSFDLNSLSSEVDKLAEFMSGWHQEAGLDPAQSFLVGYSNGANFILAFLLKYPHLVGRAALMHAMAPRPQAVDPDLAGQRILIGWSPTDELIPESESRDLIAKLKKWGASVEVFEGGRGHQLDRSEVVALGEFIKGYSLTKV